MTSNDQRKISIKKKRKLYDLHDWAKPLQVELAMWTLCQV